jgi:hypothetical protein
MLELEKTIEEFHGDRSRLYLTGCSITRQRMGLIGGHNGSVGIPQSRPRACSGGKFAVSERRRGVACASLRSKSEIPDRSLLADRRRDWNIQGERT